MSNLELGYEIIEGFLTKNELKTLHDELQPVHLRKMSGGIRNADKKFSCVKALSDSKLVGGITKKYLNGSPKLVRAILFNKTAQKNWLVTWHQDKTVAVSKKFKDSKWGPWSIKDNTHHVQAPLSALNQMVTLRIHLDDTDKENGCLKILPQSHELGILDQASIGQYCDSHTPVFCEAKAGSVLIMRPHILHASSKASIPSQRRVLHLEFSSYELPSGVMWA